MHCVGIYDVFGEWFVGWGLGKGGGFLRGAGRRGDKDLIFFLVILGMDGKL